MSINYLVLLFTHFRNLVYYLMKRKIKISGSIYQIRGKIYLYGSGTLFIGCGSRINSTYSLNPVGRHRSTVISLAKGSQLKIGENTGISNAVIFSRIGVTIGDNCKIGGGVEIYDTDFHNINANLRRDEVPGELYGVEKPISIGNDVFIGCNSTILKGSIIPDGVIIGAQSVVSGQDIKPYEIWAGNPLIRVGTVK